MAMNVGPNNAIGEGQRFLADMDPGMTQTIAAVTAGLAATEAANTASQAESHAFIVAAGAEVLGGHPPVNSAPNALMTAGTGIVYDAGID